MIALVSALVLLANALIGLRRYGRLHGPARVHAGGGRVDHAEHSRRSRSTGTAMPPARPPQCSAPRSSSLAVSIAPLVGILDNGTAVPMAAILVATAGLATALFWSVRRSLNAAWVG